MTTHFRYGRMRDHQRHLPRGKRLEEIRETDSLHSTLDDRNVMTTRSCCLIVGRTRVTISKEEVYRGPVMVRPKVLISCKISNPVLGSSDPVLGSSAIAQMHSNAHLTTLLHQSQNNLSPHQWILFIRQLRAFFRHTENCSYCRRDESHSNANSCM